MLIRLIFFFFDYREFMFSYCLDRVLIYADQEQTMGNMVFAFSSLFEI